MIRIQIGNGEAQKVSDISPSWINQQINRRRDDGVAVCVRVFIEADSVKMTLSTPGCQGGGGGRVRNDKELAILRLWEKLHLDTESFSGGNVVAFLNQVKGLL